MPTNLPNSPHAGKSPRSPDVAIQFVTNLAIPRISAGITASQAVRAWLRAAVHAPSRRTPREGSRLGLSWRRISFDYLCLSWIVPSGYSGRTELYPTEARRDRSDINELQPARTPQSSHQLIDSHRRDGDG